MFQPAMMTDADVEPLADGVYRVLEDIGVAFQSETILQAIQTIGARVDYATERATFPRALVEEFVVGLRRETVSDTVNPFPHFAAPGLGGFGTQIAQFYYDDESQEARQGNSRDLITLIKLGDALHGEGGVGHSLLLTDVPPLVEPLEAALLLAEYAREPQAAFAWNVDQIDYLVEMGEILGVKDWYNWGAICIAHPLRFDRDIARKFARRAQEGISTGITAMPVAGATTPVTVEGFTVVSSAEHLAAWLAARAINPGVGLSGSIWAGTVDMKTGTVSYCAPDAMFYGFANAEFLRRWTGMRVYVGGGEYSAAKVPGLYTALEKAYKSLLIGAFQGAPPSIGEGLLDDGKALSPAELLIERDLSSGVGNLARTVSATEANIALDTILEVGHGPKTSYLMADHTLRNYRQNLWLPEFIDRSGWKGAASDEAMVAKARQKTRELLAEYRKPEGREDQLAAMRAVVERARTELGA